MTGWQGQLTASGQPQSQKSVTDLLLPFRSVTIEFYHKFRPLLLHSLNSFTPQIRRCIRPNERNRGILVFRQTGKIVAGIARAQVKHQLTRDAT